MLKTMGQGNVKLHGDGPRSLCWSPFSTVAKLRSGCWRRIQLRLSEMHLLVTAGMELK